MLLYLSGIAGTILVYQLVHNLILFLQPSFPLRGEATHSFDHPVSYIYNIVTVDSVLLLPVKYRYNTLDYAINTLNPFAVCLEF